MNMLVRKSCRVHHSFVLYLKIIEHDTKDELNVTIHWKEFLSV